MNKKAIGQEIGRAINYASEQLTEHLQDVSHKIVEDQAEWLDQRMKDILPPDIYDKARHDDCHQEVDDYFRKHNIRITFIPDSLRIRIDVAGQAYAEFVPQFTMDGVPVEMTPTQFIPDASNN